MGCRPSRRAVACVRVAGDGLWEVGGPSRPCTVITGDVGVRLRQRSSNRRNRDERRNDGGGGDPRDRYSAPPTDRQFPPHSCTSATYEHGCCGTSRITLRLSKNGSTLEIEKCDFHHNAKSCQQCGTNRIPKEEPQYLEAPLRTQSAPNLSMPHMDNKICSQPQLAHPKNKQTVNSDSDPSPFPVCHTGKLNQLLVSEKRINLRPESVRTATRIDVDVESSSHCAPSLSIDGSVNTLSAKDNSPNKKWVAQESSQSQIETPHEMLSDSQRSIISVHSETFKNDPQIEYMDRSNSLLSPYPGAHDKITTTDMFTVTDSIILPGNNYIGAVNLSTHDASISDICDTDSDTDSQSSHSMCMSNSGAGEASYDSVKAETNLDKTMNSPTSGAVSADKGIVYRHDSRGSLVITDDIDGNRHENRKITCGATDYRVRMLGAHDFEIISSMTEYGATHHAVSSLTRVDNSRVMLVACDNQVLSRDIQDVSEDIRDDCVTVGVEHIVSENDIESRNQIMPGVKVVKNQVMKSMLSVAGINKRQDRHTDKSIDTNGMSAEAGDTMHQLAHLEMSPTYVHTDFKNDFEDLFDDSSPGFDSC